jgi:hypothetical protein
VAYEVDVSTPADAAGSEIGGCSAVADGSTIGGGATGANFRGLGVFFFAAVFTASLGLGGDFAFLLEDFGALFATFFALPADFAGVFFFFFVVLLFAPAYLAFPIGRFLILLFFLAMISFLLAVLRLLVRVVLKKSAVICV